ncbi:hypothetical protein [Enterococcus mundtii]|uniref:hypothetical protein n=1 Tax=Enterococcus mundtii TaxID=53346 RepID=UPI00044D0581|nr:hypothetical protein [Enterococcus mundtii]EYT95227.1 hypothetical protein AK89_09680 [Enterococcus mundtii CRL35]
MNVSEIKELFSVEEVNQHLSDGWVFISAHTHFSQGAYIAPGSLPPASVFIVGKV